MPPEIGATALSRRSSSSNGNARCACPGSNGSNSAVIGPERTGPRDAYLEDAQRPSDTHAGVAPSLLDEYRRRRGDRVGAEVRVLAERTVAEAHGNEDREHADRHGGE